MNKIQRHRWTNGKRKITRRLSNPMLEEQELPMLSASNIHYEMASRTHGIASGGIGSIHLLARKIGLIDAIDQRLKLLKIHLPYRESDHVLNIAYEGTWGYHPLLLTLANTGEVLCVMNRSGNRPSHEGATEATDDATRLCLEAGFLRILLRGDTDFTQTRQLDRWSEDPRIQFIFGIDAMPVLNGIADDLPQNAWRKLVRRVKHVRHGEPRRRPKNVKERVVRDREFENIRLNSEEIAEFDYRPSACRKTYRVVVVRKNLSVERGDRALFDDLRYFFYITNDRVSTAEQIVFEANDRCNQENVIEQLKNGARALLAPVDTLVSNWAYMTMASLVWNLKAWWSLMLPERPGRWAEQHRSEKETVLRMEFKKFLACFMQIPCQIVRTGRRILYRMLAWNPWQPIFFRLYEVLRC